MVFFIDSTNFKNEHYYLTFRKELLRYGKYLIIVII